MGRVYTSSINIGTAVTAPIDVFELRAGLGRPLLLHEFELGQLTEVGEAQEEQLELALKRVTGTPTSGSGGGTGTFNVITPNDVVATATLETGNTTKLTGGTTAELRRLTWNVRTERLYLPTPECRIVLDAGTYLVLELVTTPADPITGIKGGIVIEELV